MNSDRFSFSISIQCQNKNQWSGRKEGRCSVGVFPRGPRFFSVVNSEAFTKNINHDILTQTITFRFQ